MPLTLTLPSLRNPHRSQASCKSQHDYIPTSQPVISFRSVKKGRLITVPAALSAAEAAQLHCVYTALLLCWYKDIQVRIRSEQSAGIVYLHSPTRKLLYLWRQVENLLAPGQNQRGTRPSSIPSTSHLQLETVDQPFPSIFSFLFVLWILPHHFDPPHPHPRNSRTSHFVMYKKVSLPM